jgi:predicted 3-demethylubiquinone-9 3-methyltransferase (glyoxalase superfamily)
MTKPAKNTVCLWYDRDAEAAAQFYAKTFPDSSVDAVHGAPGDFPSGKKGDVLTVEFTVTPIVLMEAITDPDPAAAKRAFDAMMDMGKIDIAAIEAARRG